MSPLLGTSKQSQQIQASLHAPPPVRSRPTQTLPASTRYRHTPDASMRSIRSSPIEPFVAPLSTATHSMRSFIAPEQKHPLIGIRQGRLLDKLPPYVPRSMRFIQYTPKQSLLMRAVATSPDGLFLTRGFQQCPAQKAHSEDAPSNMLAQSIPHALRAIQSRKHPLLDKKAAPQMRSGFL